MSAPNIDPSDLRPLRDWLSTANKVEIANHGAELIARLADELEKAVREYEDWRFGPGRLPDAAQRAFAVEALRHAAHQNLDPSAFAEEVKAGRWPTGVAWA